MDITFKCPECDQELEVDAAGGGSTLECPSCSSTITVPVAEPAETVATEEAPPPAPPAAPGKAEKVFVVPVNSTAAAILIQKPTLRPLEVLAKEGDKTLRLKTFRRIECVQGGQDHFDEVVSQFLEEVGHGNIVSVHPISYSRVDPAVAGSLLDYGVMIVFKG